MYVSYMVFLLPFVKLWAECSIPRNGCVEINDGFPSSLCRMYAIKDDFLRRICTHSPQRCVAVSTRSRATLLPLIHETCAMIMHEIQIYNLVVTSWTPSMVTDRVWKGIDKNKGRFTLCPSREVKRHFSGPNYVERRSLRVEKYP